MPNVYTDAGQDYTVDVMDPATRAAQPTTYYGAWGSGSAAPAVGQTALGSPHTEARVVCTVSQPASNTLRLLFQLTANANKTINEFAVFDALTGGRMLVRGTLSVPLSTGEAIEFAADLVFRDETEA